MPYKFPCTVDAVLGDFQNFTSAEAEAAAIHLDSSWNDTPSVYLVSNDPEVGPPIRRLRSRNIKHTVSVSFSIDNYWYNKMWIPFIKLLHGGIDHFLFPEITYNKKATEGQTDIKWRPAFFQINGGSAFSIKRQDNYTYTISATVVWIEEDAINAY